MTGYFTNDASGATYTRSPRPGCSTRAPPGAARCSTSRVKQTVLVANGTSGVPANAIAVTGNVTVTRPDRAPATWRSPPRSPSGIQPPTSTLNFPAGDTRANGVTVPLAAGGKLDVMYWAGSTATTTQVIFDVTGYFAAP